jgi:hypothetical protein
MNSFFSDPWIGCVQTVLGLLGTWLLAFGLKSVREANGFDTSHPQPQSWRLWAGLVLLTLATVPSLLHPFTLSIPRQEQANSLTSSNESKTLASAEEFAHKSRCAAYKESVKKELKDMGDGEELEEIFYSPKLNTCIAVSSIAGSNFPIFEMRDVLAGKRIYFAAGSHATVMDDRKKLEDKIAEFKKSY